MINANAIRTICRDSVRLHQTLLFQKLSNINPGRRHSSNVAEKQRTFRLAIIGSGPAGFYSAYRVMSRVENAVIDMYEKLPVPFGLVRFGVAPDHPEVKNCEDKFTEVASSPRFNFIGNVEVGKDLPLSTLEPHYDGFLFAYGASVDRKLGIDGEDSFKGIYSARAFVGWYNGLPDYEHLSPNLQLGEDAVVIGQGNVALDVARILLSDVERLDKTDIAAHAISILSKSTVKRVRVVGRRGPMQASFTIKEVRELMNLPGVKFELLDPSLLPPEVHKIHRSKRRIAALLSKGSPITAELSPKSWSLNFFQSPICFTSTDDAPDRLSCIEFARTEIKGPDPFDAEAKIDETPETIQMPASVAFRSIGYKCEAIPGMQKLGIPFDERLGVIPNDSYGRVTHVRQITEALQSNHVPGMYCTGWVKNGPTGVIATTMDDAFTTAEAIAKDWHEGRPFIMGSRLDTIKAGWDALKGEAATNGLRPVSWEDWLKIDYAEIARGRTKGKAREKFTSVDDMLHILD